MRAITVRQNSHSAARYQLKAESRAGLYGYYNPDMIGLQSVHVRISIWVVLLTRLGKAEEI
jgi:hypothetical protein